MRGLDREGYGSSPRLRGTCGPPRSKRCPHRFIPAPAGNMISPINTIWFIPVHPRACGEHDHSRPFAHFFAGSSPRLRGTCENYPGRSIVDRFIPAPAGNISSEWSTPTSSAVHPRACGEHLVGLVDHSPQPGSSPRLRGTLTGAITTVIRLRFIPAPAGNIMSLCGLFDLLSVHPRACGEHLARQRPAVHLSGSSPRLRGTLR